MIGVPLTTHTGKSGPGDASQSDEAFQKLLLELSRAAFQSTDPSHLIRSFCTLTRAFFHASGAYFWSRSADGELVGTEAAADQAESFRGIRRRAGDASIAMDAVQRRRAFFVNHLDVARYPWLAECHAHAAMAAPLLVSGEVVGAITFLRSAPGASFDDDAVAKVTILASQLGTALEALRLNQLSREEHRRASILVEVATALHGLPDTASIMVSIAGSSHFGDDSPPGVLIAVPFRTSRSHGTILVYPRLASAFSEEEKGLISALAGFGAVAIANAELYGMARAQAHELHEILEISFELGSAGKLDEFMQTSVVRAASFLGFGRCFIGLLEDAAFRIRWGVENGVARPVDIPLGDGVATRALKQKNVFFTDDASKTPGANLDFIAAFQIRQLLAVPLLGSNGEVLGMFGVLDRTEPGPISDEDVRRARALAAQVAIALELTRNLHQSEEHRRRAEALVAITLELNNVLHLPEFTRNFALRAASLLGGRSVGLSLFQTSEPDTVLVSGASEVDVSEVNASQINDKQLLRRFSQALAGALPKYPTDVAFAPAAEILGAALASSLGWTDCTLV